MTRPQGCNSGRAIRLTRFARGSGAPSDVLAVALSTLGALGCSNASAEGRGTDSGLGSQEDGSGAPGGALVGTFRAELTPPSSTSPTGVTKVIGKVSDGPSPAAIVWSDGTDVGGCRLTKPRVPFCDPGCGAAVCVEDDSCQVYPKGVSVGRVTVTGIETASGESTFTMDPVAGGYQPVGISLAYPGFADGDTVRFDAAGGDHAAFSLEGRGVDPIDITSTALVLDGAEPLALSWVPGKTAGAARVHVKLDISHHGGTKGKIECDVEDDGALDIAAELIRELLGLGAAGFPTIVVARESSTSAVVPPGSVELVVASGVERAVTIPGIESCSADAECTAGKTCQANLTCG